MRQALAFLTPLGGATAPSPAAFDWFPAVGAGLGLALGAAWWAAAHVWPPVVAAAVVLGADLAVTGLLHVDGLADAADGLLPHLERARRLDVMAEPAVGAFGVATVVVVLVLRWAALAAMRPSVLLLGGLWCSSRAGMAVLARAMRYAREDKGGGLASAFLDGAHADAAGDASGRLLAVAVPLALGGVGTVALVAVGRGGPGVVAAVAGWAAAAAVAALAQRRIGGFTGDVLGAAALVSETVGLVVAAARW